VTTTCRQALLVGELSGWPGPGGQPQGGAGDATADLGGWRLHRARDVFAALELLGPVSPDAVVVRDDGPPVAVLEFLAEVDRRDPYTVRHVVVPAGDVREAVATFGPTHTYLGLDRTGELPTPALLAALEAAAEVRDAVVGSACLDALGGADTLPHRPSVHAEMLDATSRPDAGIPDIVAVIERDVATVSEILRVVNSAYFGMPVHVDGIDRAVTLLGTEMVEAIAVAGAVFGSRAEGPPGVDLDDLAARGVRVATTARRFAQIERWSAEVRSNLFVAGLLHEIGLLVLAARDPAAARALADARPADAARLEAHEVAAFGCSVAGTSAVLLREWGFGPGMVNLLAAQRHGAEVSVLRSPMAACLGVARAVDLAESAGRDLDPRDLLDPWLTRGRVDEWLGRPQRSAAQPAAADPSAVAYAVR
jgi:HD-like signal output (HDOD) protein